MIVVEKINVDSIPILHVCKKEIYNDQLPFIIFVHGFQSAKENNLHYAYLLAEKGFRVVLPEAIFHGERQANTNEMELKMQFWNIVLNTIYDLEPIKNYFLREHVIDSENIGLAGTSMGGIVTLGALTQYPWIKASVSLMGAASYEDYALLQVNELRKNGISLPIEDKEIDALLEQLRMFDLSRQPDKLAGRPLLFWHGKNDKIVPYHYSYHFYDKIRPFYKGNTEKVQFILDDKADHKVTQEGVFNLVRWFETYLKPSKMIYPALTGSKTPTSRI